MNSIEAVSVATILDALGRDAVETEVVTTSGYGRCSFPAPRAATKSAREEVGTLIGRDANQQADVDEILQDVFVLPNVSMTFSVAIANAAAASLEMPLYRYLGGPFANAMPCPLVYVFHAAARYLVAPVGASSFSSGIAASISVYREFSKLRMPREASDVDVLSRLSSIVHTASSDFGFDVKLGVDFRSSQLISHYYNGGQSRGVDRDWVRHVVDLIERFDLYYVQIPLIENDQDYAAEIRNALHKRCIIALGARNGSVMAENHERDISENVDVAPLTPTRTISSLFQRCADAKAHSLSCIMLTRNSTTCEISPSHLAVALAVPFIELSVMGSENTSKINELLRIEQELYEGSNSKMAEIPI